MPPRPSRAAASAAQPSEASASPGTFAFSTFVEACESAGYGLPGDLSDLKQFLSDAQTAEQSVKRNKAKLEERCAALIWARKSLESGGRLAPMQEPCGLPWPQPFRRSSDPSTPSRLTRETDLPLSPLALLADQIVLFTPAGAAVSLSACAAASSAPGAGAPGGALPQAIVIDITRPGGAPGPAAPLPPPPPPSLPPQPVQPPQSSALHVASPHGPLKRKWLKHEALANVLHPAALRILDNYSHLEIDKKQKLRKSVAEASGGSLWDPCATAPFSHQYVLQHLRGEPWSSLTRGMALAAAGRTICLDQSGNVDAGAIEEALITSESVMLYHQARWEAISWSSPAEIGSSDVTNCWAAVATIMRRRVAHSAHWGCPEVQAACAEQCRQVDSYQSQVSTAILSSRGAPLRGSMAGLVTSSSLHSSTPSGQSMCSHWVASMPRRLRQPSTRSLLRLFLP